MALSLHYTIWVKYGEVNMLRRTAFALLAVLALAAGRADAVTLRDVIELSKAGLSDQVLLALIEVDRSVFAIDTPTMKELKQAGVSDAVIVAMIRSGRDGAPRRQPEPEPSPVTTYEPPPRPEPEVIVIDHHDAPVQVPVAVPYPVAVPVVPHGARQPPLRGSQHGDDDARDRCRPGEGASAGAGQLHEGAAGVLGIRRQAASRLLAAAAHGRLPLIAGRVSRDRVFAQPTRPS